MSRREPADTNQLVTEERARAIWKRAAQLQAEAAQRLEERSRSLAGGEIAPADGYRIQDVEAAAVEAGIAPEFVRLALAEESDQTRRSRPLPRRLDRAATRLLGTERRSIEVTRIISAQPHAVFEAMQRLFPQRPYLLELRDSMGADPLEGGILVFGTPGMGESTGGFAMDMAYADLKELHVVLRPVRQAAQVVATEVTVSSDLTYSRKLNWWVGAGAVGTVTFGGGAAVGSLAMAAGVAGALVALPMVAGGLAAGGLMTGMYRGIYRWGVRKGVKALERMLHALDVNTRTSGAFAPPRGAEDARSS